SVSRRLTRPRAQRPMTLRLPISPTQRISRKNDARQCKPGAAPVNDRFDMRLCLLIPHYEHAGAIGPLLERLAPYDLPCIVVDDGSGPEARAILERLAARLPWVTIVWRSQNGGQGAAKRTGYRHALAAAHT